MFSYRATLQKITSENASRPFGAVTKKLLTGQTVPLPHVAPSDGADTATIVQAEVI